MVKFSTVIIKSILLVFLVTQMSVEVVRAQDFFKCPESKPTTALRRLIAKFSSNYDTSELPVQQNSNDTVNVRIRVALKRIDFNDKQDTLEIHSLFIVHWTDCRRAWDPSKYDNVREVSLPSYYFWKPDIGDMSTLDVAKVMPLVRRLDCILHYKGAITCSPPYNHVVTCSADLTLWPYDTHKCTMIIGSWTHTGERMNMSFLNPGIYLSDYNANREWQLTSKKSYKTVLSYKCCPNDTYILLSFEFVLERHPGSYSATVIMPAVVLMVLTLVTYWMEPSESDRMIVSAVLTLSHFLYLLHLGRLLPANGDQTPLIVTFYRDSMFLAATALFTAIIVPDLRATSINLPPWASGLTSWVLQNRFGKLFISERNSPAEIDASGVGGADFEGGAGVPTPSWSTFTSLLDFILFLVTLLSYFILLLGYIP